MPAERSRKSSVVKSVPEAGDPDRKRVLNVLAQRRYRQRRRDKIAALEAQAKKTPSRPVNDHEACANDTQFIPEPQFPLPHASDFTDLNMYEDFAENEDLSRFNFDHNLVDLALRPTPLTSPPFSSQSSSYHLASDGALLPIPLLSALHAFYSIATALNVTAHVWDPSYLHVLTPPTSGLSALPVNLHPVSVQLTVPHHPVLDILPWPSVREKLICMLAMPSPFRPPVAQEVDEEMLCVMVDGALSEDPSNNNNNGIKQSGAIVQLIQDIDDLQDGGGLIVHGNTTSWSEGNEMVMDAWEVGAAFYRRWWWCLDPTIVETSNRKRRERGLGRLTAA